MAASLGWSVFARSLLVQASWNFQRLQNLGFFLMVYPALARRHRGDDAALAGAALRHLRTFNSHPYLGGLVAGTVIREEDRGADPEFVDGIKRSLMCVLGSVGDDLFWATLRPLAALAALPAALAGQAWAPLVLLALYNAPHLAVRGWGVRVGLSRGRGVLAVLERRTLSRYLPALGGLTAVLVGYLVGAYATDPRWGVAPSAGGLAQVAAAGLFALFALLQLAGLRAERLLGGLVAAAAAAGVARVVLTP